MTYTRAQLEVHWRPMVRVARSVLGSREEAEECAGAAMLQVLERCPSSIDNLEAFMVTVAKRRAVDRQRALARARRRDERLVSHSELTVTDIAEDVVQRSAARWISEEAARRLSPRSYRILVATANEEDLREVAAREGLSLRAAQSDLFRSRRMLRSVWARALAGIGVLWAGFRRAPVAAGPSVLVAMALTLIPSVQAHKDALPEVGGQQAVTPFEAQTTAFVTAATVSADVSSPTSESAGRAHTPKRVGQPREVVVSVKDPAGRTTVYKDRHGDGEDAGLVGGAVECLENLSLDPHQLGC